jgi:hypothetical protein
MPSLMLYSPRMLFYFFIPVVFLFSSILCYILFAPIVLEINSAKHLYLFRIVPMVSIRWVTDPFPGYPELNVFGFRKKLNLSPALKKNKVLQTKNTHSSGQKIKYYKIISVFKSFRVKKWLINIDTADVALNGLLFPAAYTLRSSTGKYFNVNFRGINEVEIIIRNNVFSMLKAYYK